MRYNEGEMALRACMKIQKVIFVISILLANNALGQFSPKAESLLDELVSARADTSLMRINLAIADDLLFTHPDTVDFFLGRSFTLAEKLRDTSVLAKANNLQGIAQSIRGRDLTALEHYQKSLGFYEALNDSLGMANLVNNIGTIYSKMGNDSAAIAHYKESYRMKEGMGLEKKQALNLFNIATSFNTLRQFDSAMWYTQKLNDLHARAGEVFIEPYPILAQIFLEREQYDSALHYYQLYYDAEVKQQDAHFVQTAALGLVRSHLGLESFNEAERILNMIEPEAKYYSFSEHILEIYELRAELYNLKGEYNKAFAWQKKAIAFKDSVDQTNNASRLQELSVRYEAAKRDKELIEKDLIISEQDASRKAIIITATIIGIAVLTIICLIVLFLVRNRKQNKLLNMQNKEIDEQRQKIISSINYAKKIQSSMLIPEEGIRRHFPDSFVYFKPKDIVSGDFYWFTELGDKIMLSTIDCTGHGVPGAFMSLIANSKLNKVVKEKGIHDPAKILSEVHREIVESLNQNGAEMAQDGMDMSLCLIDKKQRRILYAGAQNSIFLINGESLEEIKADTISIGGTAFEGKRKLDGQAFSTKELHYDLGTYLFMFTDGYLDQFGGEENKKFNKGRFRKLMLEVTQKGITHAKSHIEQKFEDWRKNNPQIDDVLIIGARL
jgi:serine phosphatase RsbU (regulator of sigma subunit)